MILLALDWLRPFDACGDGDGDGNGDGDGPGYGDGDGYGDSNNDDGDGYRYGSKVIPPCVSQMYLLAQVLEDP